MSKNEAKDTIDSGQNPGEQAGELKTGDFKHRPPYRLHTPAENFHTEHEGSCHCGRVQFQLSRKEALNAKYCHCTTCQVLQGSPFQWAAIFHKDDMNFTNGIDSLTWYDGPAKMLTHSLPCKVSCSYCRTPIMDEGRTMLLLYPTLIKGISRKSTAECFAAKHHMFYPSRVLDIHDNLPKWRGLDNQSDLLDDEGNVIKTAAEVEAEAATKNKNEKNEENKEPEHAAQEPSIQHK